jgi:hypothetical protein
VGTDVAPDAVLVRYRAEIAAANGVIAVTDLDAAPAQRDAWWGEWEVPADEDLGPVDPRSAVAGPAGAARSVGRPEGGSVARGSSPDRAAPHVTSSSPRKPVTASLNAAGWSRLLAWPASGSTTLDAPGILAAM